MDILEKQDATSQPQKINYFKIGVFFGLGFMIPMWCFYLVFLGGYTVYCNYKKETGKTTASCSKNTGEADIEKDVIISNVEEHKGQSATYFTGQLTNKGNNPTGSFQVEIDLFKDNKFVDQYSEYIAGSLKPGDQKYFKISCGCKDTPPSDYDSHKVRVVDY